MNATALRATAQQWLAQGVSAAVVRIEAVRGSVPREAGVRMVVSPQEVIGTIGGGHLEWTAIQQVRRCLRDGRALASRQPVSLGPTLGQCCGGALELHIQALDDQAMSEWPEAAPRFELMLYGAGHVGRALVRLLVDIDCRVHWVDVRDDAFEDIPAVLGPNAGHVHCTVSDSPVADALAAPTGAHHLVMTHSHALDYDIIQALLGRHDTGLVGLIGSRTKRLRFEHRLQARGVSPSRIAELVCPVGLPGIVGKSPAVVAVAVAAQLLSLPARIDEAPDRHTGLNPRSLTPQPTGPG